MKMSKNFIAELLRLAEIALDVDGDTIEFTLAKRDGIKWMLVSLLSILI